MLGLRDDLLGGLFHVSVAGDWATGLKIGGGLGCGQNVRGHRGGSSVLGARLTIAARTTVAVATSVAAAITASTVVASTTVFAVAAAGFRVAGARANGLPGEHGSAIPAADDKVRDDGSGRRGLGRGSGRSFFALAVLAERLSGKDEALILVDVGGDLARGTYELCV